MTIPRYTHIYSLSMLLSENLFSLCFIPANLSQSIVAEYAKEVLKSNFRQYGQMKSRDGKMQRIKSEEKVREEKVNEGKVMESQKKEGAGARKGWRVPKHCVFPMICGCGGSKSRLANGAGGASWPEER